MPDLAAIDEALASVQASEVTLSLLRDLHTQALTEPPYNSTDSQPHDAALERFVALDPEKCALVYLLLRATGARFVVEAGTSFGVSTIYLALAVAQNASSPDGPGKVIATENEPTKASKARQHWQRAGDDLARRIELREGDLRETLKTNLPEQIDFLLLDSTLPRIPISRYDLMRLWSRLTMQMQIIVWCFLAMPTLAVVKPHLKVGAMVVVDNTISGSAGYTDLMAHLADPKNGFRCTTAPYAGGLHIAVYMGAGNA